MYQLGLSHENALCHPYCSLSAHFLSRMFANCREEEPNSSPGQSYPVVARSRALAPDRLLPNLHSLLAVMRRALGRQLAAAGRAAQEVKCSSAFPAAVQRFAASLPLSLRHDEVVAGNSFKGLAAPGEQRLASVLSSLQICAERARIPLQERALRHRPLYMIVETGSATTHRAGPAQAASRLVR